MIQIKYDLRDWSSDIKYMQSLAPGVQRAVSQALSNSGDKVRTQVRHALQRETGAKKYATIVERTGGYMDPPGSWRYVIFVSGRANSIAAFSARAARGGIVAAPWGVSRLFQRSFVMPHSDRWNPSNFRARLPDGKLRRLYGPNLAKEVTVGRMPMVFWRGVQGETVTQVTLRLEKVVRSGAR